MKDIYVYIVPLFILFFVIFGLVKKVGVYDCFLQGAKEGFYSMAGIVPTLVGLMAAISMLRASGAIDIVGNMLSPVLKYIGIPAEVLPLAVLRPVSGSGALAIVSDIFKNLGPDSLAGRISSVMMGSTETTFYTVAVCFGAVGIKNTRHTIPSALVADISAVLLSGVAVRVFLGNWI